MQVGLASWDQRFPGDTRSLPQAYKDTLEMAVRADALGYDFFWFGEHHFMDMQWATSPLVMLSNIAARTSRMRLGVNVLLTPLYEPVRLSEDVATLDILSEGRVDLILGSGSITFEFETFRIPPEERFARMWETKEILRRSFSEEQFDYDGKIFQIPHLRQTTKPLQQPFPLWFGGAGPKSLRRAGREGLHLQCGAPTYLEEYDAGLAEGGHDPSSLNLAGMTSIHVVATAAEAPAARERAEQILRAQNEEYSPKGRDLAFSTAQLIEVQRKAFANLPPVGTPDMVLKELEAAFAKGRYTHLQVALPEHGSLELFAKEIAPVLHGWGRRPV